jgi:hypothetical protein
MNTPKKVRKSHITAQAAGAFGEKAVEAELLRRNWMPANINATVKNAARFDIYARNERDSQVQIRVKTCRPSMGAFLMGGFKPNQRITAARISDTDFTIIVRMGGTRANDQFYVVPTVVVWTEIGKRQREHKKKKKVKDIGMWRLSFKERKDGQKEAGAGIEKKWFEYLDKWELLDRPPPVADCRRATVSLSRSGAARSSRGSR